MNGSVARIVIIVVALVGLGWLGYTQWPTTRLSIGQTPAEDSPPDWPSDDPDVLFSAPGVTEPATRTIQIFSELMGTIGKICVDAGDRIKKGQVLFELVNDTQMAEVRRCETQVARARADLAKLESWDRPEDRQMAKAQWEEAQAYLERAEYEDKRIQKLVGRAAASDKESSDTRHDLMVARARANAAKARYDRAVAGPTPEELQVARAAVAEAESQLEVYRSQFEKTRIRSPIDGVVIYRFREPGESVFPNVPAPVLSIGNRDVLHLRADVDEMDLSRVKLGQRVFATCETFGSRRFPGKVVQIAQTLGRKNFRTDRPTEKMDTKILEVVIALDDGRDLPVELQMSVWFLRDRATSRPAK
jgi:HlyD family secretion protein